VPFISVDTKKKELVGNFKNAGREWQAKGEPDPVDVHDFPSDAVGKARRWQRRLRKRRYRPLPNDNYISPLTTITSPHPQQRDVGG
jgi:hypothetical protein